jgi:hypothetical protein
VSRWVAAKNWKRKGQAKHFTTAKAIKAARAEKAWLKKSKTPSDKSPGA